MKISSYIVFLSVFVSACAVGPDYVTPDLELPENFTAAPSKEAQASDLECWWKIFQDPMLESLISESIETNLDLELAESRVVEARQQLRLTYGVLIPSLSTHTSYTRSRNSRNGSAVNGSSGGGNAIQRSAKDLEVADEPPDISDEPGSNPTTLSALPKNLFEVGFDSAWELDFFGGKRRQVEAAGYALEAQIENRRNVLVTLLAEVAQNYITLRGLQHEISITQRNIEAETETLEIQKARLSAGITNDLTVAQAEAQLTNTQAQLPSLETAKQAAVHRLSILLGREPAALESRLSDSAPIPVGPSAIPPGLPSELLLRRPDIRAVERQLAEATAGIGVAKADLFPSVTLTGKAGWRSEKFSNIDDSHSLFWSFGPSIRLPIFDLGPIWANVQVQTERQHQAFILYRQAVLHAFEEVENSLVALTQEQVRREALARSVNSNRRAFDLAKQLNDAGVIDFLNVLSAQLALFQAEDQLARSEQTVSTNLVAVYKALGGGWEALENN